MASLTIKDAISLTGTAAKIPRLGFGVYKAKPEVTTQVCLQALQAGYRHIDTAQGYNNEKQVGEAVRQSKIPRSEVFITTKIWDLDGSADDLYKNVIRSLASLDLEYIDLFLAHTPSIGPQGRKNIWKALERLHKEGKTKAIGVSNYGVKHLEEMKDYAETFPVLNQIELHPWGQQREIVKWCEDNKIQIAAYCPIARAGKLSDPTITKIAEAHKKTTAQVLIRWSLQRGYVPLPKSVTESRIKENADVFDFELSDAEMDEITALDQGRDGLIAWQPQYDP